MLPEWDGMVSLDLEEITMPAIANVFMMCFSAISALIIGLLTLLGVVAFGLTFGAKPETVLNQDVVFICLLFGAIAYVRGYFHPKGARP